MEKNKIVKITIITVVSVVILLLGMLTGKLFFTSGLVIGLLLGVFNMRLFIYTTFRGLQYETRGKMRRYYFLTNLAKYAVIVLFIYLIVATKKISLVGIIFGLILSVFLLLSGIY
ncbi:MAG TPA: hypothetical protein DHV62_03490 [Elusimicrobia bacterium]|jgi:hypothetical protein|nr:hypothetical protein [Elusimicrobiota bacterium]